MKVLAAFVSKYTKQINYFTFYERAYFPGIVMVCVHIAIMYVYLLKIIASNDPYFYAYFRLGQVK